MASPSPSGVAPDGSPVEVYLRLPPAGEAELVDRHVPKGAAVLELGAGVGRVTRGLVALGHPVTAVDESPEMLEHVRDAERVCASIEGLDVGRRFPVVLLASHFVNDADRTRRRAFLEACARHVEPNGSVLVQSYDPELDWASAVRRSRSSGDVAITVVSATQRGTIVDATVEYRLDGRSWRQAFTAEMLDDDALREELDAVGRRFEGWLDRANGWLLARG